jgi:hypothetical protein
MARMQTWFTFSAILAMLLCPGCASKSDVRNLPVPSSSSEPGLLGGMVRDGFHYASDSYRFGSRNASN